MENIIIVASFIVVILIIRKLEAWLKSSKKTKHRKYFRKHKIRKDKIVHSKMEKFIADFLAVLILIIKKFVIWLKSRKKHSQEQESRKIITQKGEEVRSKMEKFIADFLYEQKIDYEYEKEIVLKNGAEAHPDFYLPEYDLYMEYFGMINDPKYRYNIHFKMESHKKENMHIIYIWPPNAKYGTLNWQQVKSRIAWQIKKNFEKELGLKFPQKKAIFYAK